MSATIDGVVSGLDTTAIINATVEAAAIPMRLMEKQLAEYEDKKSKIATFNSNLSNLAEKLKEIAVPEALNPYKADFADASQFTVQFGAGTVPGTYRIQVQDTAQSATSITDQGFAAKDTAGLVATGSFDVTYDGTTTSISVDASDTLETIASKVNAISGITSYVLDTGDATDPYKLVVAGEETGLDHAISLDASGLTGSGTAITFNDVSAAQDARVTVNGIDLYSNTNHFENAIPGMTLDALATGASEVLVNVSLDDAAITEKVQEFVDAFNEVKSFYDTQTVFNPDAGIRGSLVGDSTARRVMDGLAQLVSGAAFGDSGLGNVGMSLSQIGVLTTRDGTLELNEDTLEAVVQDNPAILSSVFIADSALSKAYSSSSDAIGVTETLTVTHDGSISQVNITAGQTVQEVASELNNLSGVQAYVLEQDGEFRVFAAQVDSGLGTFKIESTGSGTNQFLAATSAGERELNPVARIVNGIEDIYIDSEDGLLTARKDSLESSIEDLESRIEDWQGRMDRQAEMLRAKFTRLEVTLGQLQQSQGFLSALGAGAPAGII